MSHVFRLCVLSRCSPVPAMTESPFAWLGRYPAQESVVRSRDRRYPTLIAPTDSCARPQPLEPSAFALGASLCRLLRGPAGRRSFPALSPQIFPQMLGPLPRRFSSCTCPLLPRRPRPSPTWERLGNTHTCRTATSVRGSFSGLQSIRSCSGLWVCSPPSRSYRRASSRLGAAVAFTSEHRTVCYLAVPRIC